MFDLEVVIRLSCVPFSTRNLNAEKPFIQMQSNNVIVFFINLIKYFIKTHDFHMMRNAGIAFTWEKKKTFNLLTTWTMLAQCSYSETCL